MTYSCSGGIDRRVAYSYEFVKPPSSAAQHQQSRKLAQDDYDAHGVNGDVSRSFACLFENHPWRSSRIFFGPSTT
jgi:hypothetical protein